MGYRRICVPAFTVTLRNIITCGHTDVVVVSMDCGKNVKEKQSLVEPPPADLCGGSGFV